MKTYEKIIKFDKEGNANISLGENFSQQEAKIFILLNDDEDISEKSWMRAAMNGCAFDFLNDPSEDIYTINDGIPYERK